MTFSYTPSTSPSDVTLVRYHIRDTVEAAAMFSDEEIEMILAQNNASVGKTVISLIQAKRAEIANEPDMTQDWLTISWRRSDAAWAALLAEKRREFGLTFTVTTTQKSAYRKDSLQRPVRGQTDYEPDYSDTRATDYRQDEYDNDDKPIWE